MFEEPIENVVGEHINTSIENESDVEGELNLKCITEENAELKKRYISSLKEYRCVIERKRADTDYQESILDVDFTLSRMLSFLKINELLTVRCVSRKLRNWSEFELKSRKHIFVITDKHKSDYEIFQNFNLFPNIRTLVIEKLHKSVNFNVVLQLCKDFLTQLQYIVLEDYDKYMKVCEIFGKIDIRASSDPFAQQLMANLRKNLNLSIGDKFCICLINGLPRNTKDEIEEIERLRERNTFLRDKSELLEKECQRIKNYENLSLFSILPEEVTLKILDVLTVSELFSLRLVSKEMKQWADIAIRSRKQILDINLGWQTTYRIYLWSNLYSNIKTLTISGTGIDLEVLLRIFENKFPFLKNLIVCSCESHNIELFGEYFPTLQNLTLRYTETVGEGIACLLSKLPQLNALLVNGSVNTGIAPFFSFGRNATNLKSFTCECYVVQEINCKDISNTLVVEMPNLTSLHLNLASTTLLNFSDLQLMTIKELELCCSRLEGCLTLSQKVTSITKLILNTETSSADEIAAVLNNFKNLKTLELDLFRNHDIRFSATLVEALVGLNSLKYFSLFDAFYSKEKYYTLNDCDKSALVEVLAALKNVDKMKIEFCQQSYDDDDLVTAVNKLTAKRPLQNIQLIIPDNDFDLYDCFSEHSNSFGFESDYDDYGESYRDDYSEGYSD